jgi:hypothetical protein
MNPLVEFTRYGREEPSGVSYTESDLVDKITAALN